MQRYLLSIVRSDDVEAPPPGDLCGVPAEVRAFERELKAAGVWVYSGGLYGPGTATMVRIVGGEVLLTAGPFTGSGDFLAGIVVLEARDLGMALTWAERASRATALPIELRPFRYGVDAGSE